MFQVFNSETKHKFVLRISTVEVNRNTQLSITSN